MTLQSKYIFLQKWTNPWENVTFYSRSTSGRLSFRFPLLASFECVSLPKEIQRKALSSRHSNAARVSENIRLQRRAAISAASVIDAIFSARSQRGDFSPQNRVLHEKVKLLLLRGVLGESSLDAWAFQRSWPNFHSWEKFDAVITRLSMVHKNEQANAISALTIYILT